MKTTKLGMVLSAMVTGVVLLGTAATENAVAQADEGPSGSAASAFEDAVAAAQQTAPSVVTASTAVKPTTTPAVVEATSSCPRGMVEVEGDYCSSIEQKCLRWLDPDTKMRCAEFA